MIRAIALVLLLAGCANIEPRACFAPEWEWANYRAKIEFHVPNAKWVELTESERKRFLAEMNATDRPTGIMYDRIGYFRHPTAHYVVMAFIVGDCVWADAMSIETMVRWMVRSKENGA